MTKVLKRNTVINIQMTKGVKIYLSYSYFDLNPSLLQNMYTVINTF